MDPDELQKVKQAAEAVEVGVVTPQTVDQQPENRRPLDRRRVTFRESTPVRDESRAARDRMPPTATTSEEQ